MKAIVAALALFASSSAALAGTTQNLTLINHSNQTVACAFTRWDTAGQTVDTYSWFTINVGQQLTLNKVDWVHCEVQGNPDQSFFGNMIGSDQCVPGDNYVNPIYGASNANTCAQVGGRMVHFWDTPRQTNYTMVLNP